MDINGCHIVSVPNTAANDGFTSTVSRFVGFRQLPNPAPDDALKVSRGPFGEIQHAIRYAHSWNDASNPPPFDESSSMSAPSVAPDPDPLRTEDLAQPQVTDASSTDTRDSFDTANAK